MSSLKTKKISPTITEETHEFIWSIPYHRVVISDTNSLSNATRDFSFTSTNGITIYNWRLGYKPVGQQEFTPYLKLFSTDANVSDITVVQWLLYRQSESQDGWTLSTGVNPDKPISEYPDKTLITATWNLNDTSLKTNSLGTRIWKSQLVVHITKGASSTALATLNASELARHQQDFANLLENGDMADLIIVCSDGLEVKAHKLILSCKNPVFMAMLNADMVEGNTDIVQVKDISRITMKLLLHFLYTGVLMDEWRQPVNIVEFTYAAGKYQVKQVLKMLNETLGTIDHGENNLVPLMNLAHKLGLEKAERKLLQRAKETVKTRTLWMTLFVL